MSERIPFISDETTNQRKFSATAFGTDKDGTVVAVPFHTEKQGTKAVGDRIVTDHDDRVEFRSELSVLEYHLFFNSFDAEGNYV